MKRPLNLTEIVEYLTFGRQWRLLFRVWTVEVVIVFFEVEVLRTVHPAVERRFEEQAVVELYLAVAAVAVVILAAFVRRMSRLTFSATFRSPLQVGLSVLGYLALAGGVVLLPILAPGVPPSPSDGATLSNLALGLMVTSVLAVLLAAGFYALFDLEDYPSRHQIRTTSRDWLRSLDWIEEPEGSRAKRERYVEFRERTGELSRLLDYAMTEEGKRLRADFDDWADAYLNQSILSQEAIVRGDAKNERLERQCEKLTGLVDRFERIRE